MKRSELIKNVSDTIKPVINNRLRKIFGQDVTVSSSGAECLTELMLVEFERLGMRPPLHGKELKLLHELASEGVLADVDQWETENDKA